MKIHPSILIAGAAALAFTGLATAAIAADQLNRHELTIQLPNGGTERIEYTGEAPQVVFAPAPFAWPWAAPIDFWTPPPFSSFERMSADIDRQMAALFNDERTLFASPPMLADTTLANIPPGTLSTTWISTSFGNGFCTRVTQISKTSSEAKPEIVSRESGDCGSKSPAKSRPDSTTQTRDNGIIETSVKAPQADSKPAAL